MSSLAYLFYFGSRDKVAGCHWNFLTRDSLEMLSDWGCWNPVGSSSVECGWPGRPSGWSLRLFWVSVSIWTLSSTLYVNYVVVFLAPEEELNLSCCKHSLHTNTSVLVVPKHNCTTVGWESVVLPAWIWWTCWASLYFCRLDEVIGLGVTGGAYILAHFAVWILDEDHSLSNFWHVAVYWKVRMARGQVCFSFWDSHAGDDVIGAMAF
jgi:hypothetical protein